VWAGCLVASFEKCTALRVIAFAIDCCGLLLLKEEEEEEEE
jgi:hypothetical protein